MPGRRRRAGLRVPGDEQGNTVTPFYDPLLAKLCGLGESRAEALDGAVEAVAGFSVAGPESNLPFCAEPLENAEFRGGDYDTVLVARMRS
ncbi:hypothetical protein ABGB18_15980 [Nonomuraea sp. B12E4]|uniref:hypothetical protein n=1 Tax=Nonomuraea sp. B12E4 TaxID=3153564 RepID=UPI00325C4D81